MAAPTLPTLKEELDRKSFETVEFLYNALDIGKLTIQQFSAGLDALFMATAGLTNASVIDLISAGSSYVDANKDKFVDKRALYGADGTVVALTRKLGADTFLIDIYRGGKRIKQEIKDFTLAKQASDAMERTVERLLAGGYAEL